MPRSVLKPTLEPPNLLHDQGVGDLRVASQHQRLAQDDRQTPVALADSARRHDPRAPPRGRSSVGPPSDVSQDSATSSVPVIRTSATKPPTLRRNLPASSRSNVGTAISSSSSGVSPARVAASVRAFSMSCTPTVYSTRVRSRPSCATGSFRPAARAPGCRHSPPVPRLDRGSAPSSGTARQGRQAHALQERDRRR